MTDQHKCPSYLQVATYITLSGVKEALSSTVVLMVRSMLPEYVKFNFLCLGEIGTMLGSKSTICSGVEFWK